MKYFASLAADSLMGIAPAQQAWIFLQPPAARVEYLLANKRK